MALTGFNIILLKNLPFLMLFFILGSTGMNIICGFEMVKELSLGQGLSPISS